MRQSITMIAAVAVLVTITCLIKSTQSTVADLDVIMEKMAQDALDFAREIESFYIERCSSQTMDSCRRNNYDDCVSQFPNEKCLGGSYSVKSCGDGISCASLFDFTTTMLRIPKALARATDGNPTDKRMIETVCYTRLVDDYMKEKFERDRPYWSTFNNEPPQSFFGALDGVFRMYPARYGENCGGYDPRIRPWYIAGSSGPKDVILILDTSGSMDIGVRLLTMKEAAKSIIQSLTVGDRVAIVEFNTYANLVGTTNDKLVPATKQNKQNLARAIDDFYPTGITNFYDAFEKAFDAYDATIAVEGNSGCNAAILFLTDGEMNPPDDTTHTAEDVIQMVTARKATIEAEIDRPVTMFTYSMGDSAAHNILKQLACQTGGLWSKIEDERYLKERMSSYYKLFALGLGTDDNIDFTAWVEPYSFATGGWLGTTVSAPVYDRSINPHVFLGVVGLDFTLAAMGQALGESCTSSSTCIETIEAVARRSIARCPDLRLTLCELESLRRQAGGNEAVCTANCSDSDYVGIEATQCTSVSDYPAYLWANANNKRNTFEEQACCAVGVDGPATQTECSKGKAETTTTTTTSSPTPSPALLSTSSSSTTTTSSDGERDEGIKLSKVAFGLIFGGIAVVFLTMLCFIMRQKLSSAKENAPNQRQTTLPESVGSQSETPPVHLPSFRREESAPIRQEEEQRADDRFHPDGEEY